MVNLSREDDEMKLDAAYDGEILANFQAVRAIVLDGIQKKIADLDRQEQELYNKLLSAAPKSTRYFLSECLVLQTLLRHGRYQGKVWVSVEEEHQLGSTEAEIKRRLTLLAGTWGDGNIRVEFGDGDADVVYVDLRVPPSL